MTAPRLLWLANSTNHKIGRMPQLVVGATLEEARASCQGCSLLERDCYAWHNGTVVNFGLKGKVYPGLAKHGPARYTLAWALAHRARSARYVRLTMIGDAARADRAELLASLETIRSHGLQLLAYTHFWREPANQELRYDFLASCADAEEAEHALALGWRASVVLPFDHYATSGPRFYSPRSGRSGVVCPAQTKDHVTCNTCGLCSNEHRAASRVPMIGFLDHGPTARKTARRVHAKTLPLFTGGAP